MTTDTKIDLGVLPAAAALREAVAAVAAAERVNDELRVELRSCAATEARAAQVAAGVQQLRARRIELLADKMSGADVAGALAEVEREIREAEPGAVEAADQGAAAAQVRGRIEARQRENESRRADANAAMRAARYALLHDAAKVCADRFRQAREAMERSYGAMAAVMIAGTREAMAQNEGYPQEGRVQQLCRHSTLRELVLAAGRVMSPDGTPFFNDDAEARRARDAQLPVSAWEAADADVAAQLTELCRTGG